MKKTGFETEHTGFPGRVSFIQHFLSLPFSAQHKSVPKNFIWFRLQLKQQVNPAVIVAGGVRKSLMYAVDWITITPPALEK